MTNAMRLVLSGATINKYAVALFVSCTAYANGSALATEAIQWPVDEGGNGHWYFSATGPSNQTWEATQDASRQLGGHLATIRSAEENEWIVSNLPTGSAYIGGFQAIDGAEPGNGWQWVTGEPLAYTNWYPGEPNDNHPQGEDTMDFYLETGTWNDTPGIGSPRYIIEWSADCNGDGIVDYGQILDGTLEDQDGNGIPDLCVDPIGSCCLGGTCITASEQQCNDAGGTYAGAGVPCSESGCPESCLGDVTGDGQVGVNDLLTVIANWNTCP